nr:YciI family protein [Novacetimonas hansenii]
MILSIISFDGPVWRLFLIMKGANRQEIDAMIAADPFASEGLICDLRIEEWDPLFGCLSYHATGALPQQLKSIFP